MATTCKKLMGDILRKVGGGATTSHHQAAEEKHRSSTPITLPTKTYCIESTFNTLCDGKYIFKGSIINHQLTGIFTCDHGQVILPGEQIALTEFTEETIVLLSFKIESIQKKRTSIFKSITKAFAGGFASKPISVLASGEIQMSGSMSLCLSNKQGGIRQVTGRYTGSIIITPEKSNDFQGSLSK